jgi:hypothetical protein
MRLINGPLKRQLKLFVRVINTYKDCESLCRRQPIPLGFHLSDNYQQASTNNNRQKYSSNFIIFSEIIICLK